MFATSTHIFSLRVQCKKQLAIYFAVDALFPKQSKM